MNCLYRILKSICRCKRYLDGYFEVEVRTPTVSVSKLPWLWIGAELQNDEIITLTEDINLVVQPGDIVTDKYLKAYTELHNVKRWLYLNCETLKEEEIPPHGLVIENDTQ